MRSLGGAVRTHSGPVASAALAGFTRIVSAEPAQVISTPNTTHAMPLADSAGAGPPAKSPGPVIAPVAPVTRGPEGAVNGPGGIVGPGAGAGPGVGGGAGTGMGTGSGSGTGSGESGGGSGGDGPFGLGGDAGSGRGPRHIVYLLDISPSMISRIDRARAELRRALHTLRPGESFDVIGFAEDIHPFAQSLVPASPAAVAAANQFMEQLKLSPATDLERAVRLALRLRGVNVIVLLTDGVPTLGETNLAKLAARARALNRTGIRIYTVGLVGQNPDGSDQSFQAGRLLRQLAADSGGESKLAPVGTATGD